MDKENFRITLDMIEKLKEEGIKFDCSHKFCDFCNKELSEEHISLECIVPGCPTIFDSCESCGEKKNALKHTTISNNV